MKNANAIPTSQVPVLRLKCYHASVHYIGKGPQDAVTNHYGHNSFDLVDPVEGTAKLLQTWLNDVNEDGGAMLRHLEIEDRRGVHRFIAQRRGSGAMFLEGSIKFDSYTDYDSVLPNLGVTDATMDVSGGLQ